ncbi:hypothetical protein CO641_13415 [Lysobacteraceae bacterium NML91-0213]|nr:hypothetical protein CO641_13415 [Xanthomonadaceae bacterium NML91-0213]
MSRRPVRLLSLLLACIAPVMAAAQDTGHPCAATVEPAQRLACYDRAFPPPPAVHEAAAARAIDAFGRPRAATPLRGRDPTADADPDAIEARVTAVEQAGGRRTVVLANGQRWSVEGGAAGPLAADDVVTIRRGALGSHMLRTPGGASLRARRVH